MKELKNLYRKYSNPVPRYTSYPPANHFADGINSDEYQQILTESNNWKPQNISTYIHIPFCKKMCHYCGCNMVLMKRKDPVCEYVDAILTEIKMVSQNIDKSRKLSQIHFGGGTPNAIESKELRRIVDALRNEFEFIDNAEIAIECNPAYLTHEYIDDLIDTGFNRISLGIQDFDEQVLKNSNREHSAIPLEELFSYLRSKKSDISINLDFIYGLPGQTVESFLATMEKAAELKPERLVTFSYAHVPWVNPKQKYLEKLGLPEPEDKIDMFTTTYEMLQTKGFLPIGMDHFVAPDDELHQAAVGKDLHRNFQGYCTRRTTGQVYAFGVSSITQLEKAYIQNVKTTDEYIETIEKGNLPVKKWYRLTEDEIVIREVINYLMCNKAVNWERICENLQFQSIENADIPKIKEILNYDKDKLTTFVDDGIIEFEGENFTVQGLGILFIRNVAAALDPKFEVKEGHYSKSV